MKILKWLALNAGMAGLLALWYFASSYAALNLFKFGFWLCVVVSILTLLTEDGRRAARERGRHAPAWASNLFDGLLICVLASWGWFWMASFWFVQMVAQAAIYDDDDKAAA